MLHVYGSVLMAVLCWFAAMHCYWKWPDRGERVCYSCVWLWWLWLLPCVTDIDYPHIDAKDIWIVNCDRWRLPDCPGSFVCFTGSGWLLLSGERTHCCKIVRLLLCFIPVEKAAVGKAALQDTQKQGTKVPTEGMQRSNTTVQFSLGDKLASQIMNICWPLLDKFSRH